MCRALVIAIIVVSFAPELSARNKHDWPKAGKLKTGTPVSILLWSGQSLTGRVLSVSATGLKVSVSEPDKAAYGLTTDVERPTIRRIVHLRRPKLPDPERWMLVSTLAGGAVGGISGAVYDVTHKSNGHWLIDGLGGAGLGFFASCAVLAGVGLVAVFHHSTVVYEAQVTGIAPFADQRRLDVRSSEP